MVGDVPDPDPLDEATVNAARETGLTDIEAVDSLDALKVVRMAPLGDQAPLVAANRMIGSLEPAQRGLTGKNLGQVRKVLTKALGEYKAVLAVEYEVRMLVEESANVTPPATCRLADARHPPETLMEEVADLFVAMSWGITEGPEIEYEWFSFDSPNFDIDHPACQMQDILYADGHSIGAKTEDGTHLMMRTHTSPIQLHTMLSCGVPLYVACPGKVFRSDALDAVHTPVLHQVGDLAIDKDLTMTHLKSVLDHFARAMSDPETKTRLHPPYSPFTESSAEMDLWFPQKKGGPGWIEQGSYGVTNPNVLRANSVDLEVYSGFAFGVGIECMLTLRHSIADIRDVVEGNARFSQQFGMNGRGS